MKVVVPLAGGDLVHPVHGLKPLYPIDGIALVVRALESRPWFGSGEVNDADYIFVLREDAVMVTLRAFLSGRYPRARFVTLSHLTEGALLSAVVGAVAAGGMAGRVCIDLVDILYDWADYAMSPLWQGDVGAAVPVFQSQDPAFSYVRIEDGVVTEAVEKRVISHHASAGTYLFADLSIFLAAAAHSLLHADRLSHCAALFVCPAVNGVIAAGRTVVAPEVIEARSFSAMFKSDPSVVA